MPEQKLSWFTLERRDRMWPLGTYTENGAFF